ncbi:MAG: hypothetical protein M1838_002320 [Thelocarpon superellum]|nr:MAG: hypothetical protein M1838_002320 [Thelocarpon superellum]
MMPPNLPTVSAAGTIPAGAAHFHSALPHDPMQTSFKVDEGYSEETRSQAGSDAAVFTPSSRAGDLTMDTTDVGLPPWITTLPEADRSELAYSILRTLRASSMTSIIERLHPILHLDPIHYLPPELTFQIFSYLEPRALLIASAISKAWRERAVDSRLWKDLYGREGWAVEAREVRQYEEELQRGGGAMGPMRPTEGRDPNLPDAPEDQEMTDVGDRSTSATTHATPDPSMAAAVSMATPIRPTLTVAAEVGRRKLGWQYLYKQRRRLEDNWSAGRFVNFRLPHPDHEDEGHVECVYTIQYCGKYLVSGSRDKSLRIWNLDTRRLVRKPLLGHVGSVLCLQFDPSEDEDLIISGSSDTDVIVWRFSTGEKIKKIRQAHTESVLNLRFDKRYLITCSKDKTVNVWNRRQLTATDPDFPAGAAQAGHGGAFFPAHVLSMVGGPSLTAEANLGSTPRPPSLPRFSHLMTLHGHNAAVNAIQVHGDQIVSASGDRTIKIWNLQSGVCVMTIPGHNKGIACVQFDGRRIVSGSSDNTVKIFDRVTGAEVACLLGHQYLVRTVQAGFGDLPGSEEDDRADARAVDQSFFDAHDKGELDPIAVGSAAARARNAGSRDPRQITALGAALPPGGGGSRWGRIVSGSYDESVIIWKRDQEGKWVVGHRLRQEDTTRSTRGHTAHAATAPHTHHHLSLAAAAATAAAAAPAAPPPTPAQAGPSHQAQGHAPAPASASTSAHQSPPATGANATTQPLGPPPTSPPHHQPTPTPILQQQLLAHQQQMVQAQQTHQMLQMTFPATQGGVPVNFAQAFAQLSAHQQAQAQNAIVNAAAHHHHHHHHHHAAAAGTGAGAATGAGAGAGPAAAHAAGAGSATAHHPPAALHAPGPNGGNSRVFKLQFDARRVICCSQDPHIMGWDFANGDDDIVEACRFFQGLG